MAISTSSPRRGAPPLSLPQLELPRPDLLWRVTTLTLSVVVLLLSLNGVGFQGDFNGDLYLAGLRILHGLSPYDLGLLQHQAQIIASGGTLHFDPSPRWPPAILLVSAPLALLGQGPADLLFLAVSVVGVLVGLRMLGVRDSRCVLVALVSCPTVIGLMVGNVSPLIFLGAAAVWRYRARVFAPAACMAAVVVAKLFLWPLGVWLLITRRCTTFAVGIALGVVALAASWAVISFAGLSEYPRLLLDLAKIGEARGCSLIGLLMYLGLSAGPARAVALVVGGLLLFLAWRLARRPELQGNAFGLVILAALAVTPIVWSHYMVLLFIPIALMSPRLSALWFLPTLAAFAPTTAPHGYGLASLPIVAAQLLIAIMLCRPLLPPRWLPLRSQRDQPRVRVATASAAAPS